MSFPAPATLATALTLLGSVALGSVALADTARTEELGFTVLKDGEAVGHHTVSIRSGPDGTRVAVDTNVVVRISIVPVYRFEHHDEELWKDGRLVSLKSTTHDDGTDHVLEVTAGNGDLKVSADGETARLPEATLPASLWNPETIRQSALMNTLDGHVMTVAVQDLGRDTVAVHGRRRAAHHYALTGDLARELWYDDSGTLVQVHFKAKDDSDILYVLGG